MNITLGITGSISAYKSIEILRLLVKDGHNVKVIASAGALQFINLNLFHYLGAQDVYGPNSDFDYPEKKSQQLGGSVLHVELAKWSDTFVIAPLSANTISKFCQAQASDLLTSLFLAWPTDKPILGFSAMNTKMLNHPFVQENLEKLKSLSHFFLGPTQSGTLACGDEGEGKLLEVDRIVKLVTTYNLKFSTKKILMSAGATVASLDSVRYLTNPSTGKTAIPFIEKGLKNGHQVCVVAGQFASSELDHYKDHPRFEIIRIKETRELADEVLSRWPDYNLYISMAAIGDIEFDKSDTKIKKSNLPQALPIKPAPDVLKEVLALKKEHQKVIGFAAESELSDEVLKRKISSKPCDLIIGTQVNSGLGSSEQAQGFGVDECLYRFIKIDSIDAPQKMTKTQLAESVAQNFF